MQGNEGAGRLAALSTVSDHADIIHTLMDIGRVENFGGSESTLLSMLCELGEKIGITISGVLEEASVNTELAPSAVAHWWTH